MSPGFVKIQGSNKTSKGNKTKMTSFDISIHQNMKLSQNISADDIFSLLSVSSGRVRNWNGRTEPSLELAERLLNKIQNVSDSTAPLLEQIDNLRFVALDFNKKCLTKKFGRSWGFSKASEVAKQFWRETVVGNLGVVCGEYQNRFLVVIDIDAKRDREASVEVIANAIGVPTFMVNTPSGGKHLYFWSKSKIGCPKEFSKAGVDIKGEGGYVVAPGSNTSKGFYTWDVEGELFSQEIAELPEDWENRLNGVLGTRTELRAHIQLSPSSSSSLTSSDELRASALLRRTELRAHIQPFPSSLSSGQLIQKGFRNSYMTSRAASLVHGVSSPEELIVLLKTIRARELEEPETFEDEEIEKIVAWVFGRESKKQDKRHTVSEELSPLEMKFSKALRTAIDQTESKSCIAINEAAGVYQAFLESKGFVFQKTIKLQVVAKVLRAAGVESTEKNVKIKGSKKRTKVRLWDVSLEALMLAFDLLQEEERRIKEMEEKIKMKARKQMVPMGCNGSKIDSPNVDVDFSKVVIKDCDSSGQAQRKEREMGRMRKTVMKMVYALVACWMLLVPGCVAGFDSNERNVVGEGSMISRPLTNNVKIVVDNPQLAMNIQRWGGTCISSRIVWEGAALPAGCSNDFDGTNSRAVSGNTAELTVRLLEGCRTQDNVYHPFNPGTYNFTVLTGARFCNGSYPSNADFSSNFNGLLRVE